MHRAGQSIFEGSESEVGDARGNCGEETFECIARDETHILAEQRDDGFFAESAALSLKGNARYVGAVHHRRSNSRAYHSRIAGEASCICRGGCFRPSHISAMFYEPIQQSCSSPQLIFVQAIKFQKTGPKNGRAKAPSLTNTKP